MFSDEEIKEFRAESQELLELAEKTFLLIDGDQDYQLLCNEAFRVFHNLKGASGMMGMDALQKHMHNMENLLTYYKSRPEMPKDKVDVFLKGIDVAKHLLSDPEFSFDSSIYVLSEVKENESAEKSFNVLDFPSENYNVSDETLAEFIAENQEICSRLANSFVQAEKEPQNRELIDSIYRDMHTVKGSSQLFGFKVLGDFTHAFENSLDAVRSGQLPITKSIVDRYLSSLSEIEKMIELLKNRKSLEPLAYNLDRMINAIPSGESEIHELTVAQSAPPASTLPSSINMTENKNTSTGVEDKEANSSIRVSVGLLDKLMNLMGEMVLVRNQVLQYSSGSDDLEFLNLSQRLNVVTGEIQNEMMKTRMQPIGNILSKFNRVVRDLSRSLNKKIELVLEGTETELDKSLLEAVKDPLTHIIRNSCDHGLETPEERRAAGKTDGGKIQVRSYHEGGQVVIEIKDDGRGLHREKILNKAVEKGIVTTEKAKTLRDDEIVQLIFAPGFSTATVVTNVSGRGVGMDVVKTNIEKIGGSIELSSRQGQGTEIKLKIPLTLAIVPAMIVLASKSYLAIPQVKLVELVRIDPTHASEDKIEMMQENPVLLLRGQILPLVDLNDVLYGQNQREVVNTSVSIVVVRADTGKFGLIVDEIFETADIVVKPLSRVLKSLSYLSGAAVIGDGSVALILDINGIARDKMTSTISQKESMEFASGASREVSIDSQEYLLFKVNSPTRHSFVMNYVHRLEEFKANQIEYSGLQPVVRYRDRILPLFDLNKCLGYESVPLKNREILPVVVVEKSGGIYGICVDQIIDVFSSSRDVEQSNSGIPGIVGNISREDEVVVLVDPFLVIDHSEGRAVVPSVRSEERARRKDKSVHGGSKQPQVLFVEDTPFFRRHICKILESAGFKVSVANNGREALDLLNSSSFSFDIILSDIEMPKMNGFQFMEEVRKYEHYKNTPAIAISTRADDVYRKKGGEAGFTAYLEKLNPEHLLETINDCMSQSNSKWGDVA
ncbi:MAG: chemotaxis protein CheW [Pseudobdellovibrionaceae bacterium]